MVTRTNGTAVFQQTAYLFSPVFLFRDDRSTERNSKLFFDSYCFFFVVFFNSLNNFKHVWQKLLQLTPYSAKMANNVGRTSELRLWKTKGRIRLGRSLGEYLPQQALAGDIVYHDPFNQIIGAWQVSFCAQVIHNILIINSDYLNYHQCLA